MPDASVLLGQVVTTTDAQGRFGYNDLPAGIYSYTVQSDSGSVLAYGSVELRQPTETLEIAPLLGRDFEIEYTDPSLSSQAWGLGWPMEIDFSEPLDPATISSDNFTFSPDIGPVLIELDDPFNDTVYLVPEQQLPPDRLITLTVSGAIRSEDGELLRLPLRTRFRTAPTDTSPPMLVRTEPDYNAADWPINRAVRFEFNEPLAEDQPALQIIVNPPTPVTWQVSGRSLLVLPVTEWQRETTYRIEVQTFADRLGNVMPPEFPPERAFFITGTDLAPADNIQPEWNRALDRIVFSSDRGGGYDLYSVAPDGSALTQLTFGAGDELHPTLSSDGALLAWQARGSSGDWDVFVGPRENASAAAAVTGADGHDTEPAFARTASRSLFFVSDRTGLRALHRMGPDGSGATLLTPGHGSVQLSPAPHPLIDNQTLFVGSNASLLDVFLLSVSAIDGTATILPATDQPLSSERDPAWGPDASFFAYVSDLSGADELWLTSLGTAPGRQVTASGGVSSPSLAPVPGDNRCVVSLARPAGGSDLVIIETIGGAIVTNLTAEGGD